jgi:hypothetical protein
MISLYERPCPQVALPGAARAPTFFFSLPEACVLPVPRWPGCGLASPQPTRLARPGPAGCGVIGHPWHRRIFSTHPKTLLTPLKQCPGRREGGGVKPPRGREEPWRRSVRAPSGQTGGWKRWPRPRVSPEGGEQRGSARRAVPARSHAKAGRRAGLEAQPERPLMARGAKQSYTVGETRKGVRGPSGPAYLAYSTARVSRMTVTLICPG